MGTTSARRLAWRVVARARLDAVLVAIDLDADLAKRTVAIPVRRNIGQGVLSPKLLADILEADRKFLHLEREERLAPGLISKYSQNLVTSILVPGEPSRGVVLIA